jgi:hypothetical protein
MTQITVNIKDKSKKPLLIQLLKQLDFVDIVDEEKTVKSGNHNLFDSAGIWEDRDVSSKQIRSEAWKRTK